jgi:hypothetical protein
MGSQPTLDPAPTSPPDPHRRVPDSQRELLVHLQTPANLGGHEFQDWPVGQLAGGFGGDLQARHRHDHTRLGDQFRHRHTDIYRADPERDAEAAFDRLNPSFGVPADRADRIGHRDLTQREAALALGIRVAVHDARQNDPDPVVWQAGQNYRMADVIHAARTHPTRAPWGPERLGPER